MGLREQFAQFLNEFDTNAAALKRETSRADRAEKKITELSAQIKSLEDARTNLQTSLDTSIEACQKKQAVIDEQIDVIRGLRAALKSEVSTPA